MVKTERLDDEASFFNDIPVTRGVFDILHSYELDLWMQLQTGHSESAVWLLS